MSCILFGHRKGAFTGAVTDSVGKVEEADLSGDARARLLRFLSDRSYERLGEAKDRRKVPFIQSTEAMPPLLLTAAIMAVGVIIPFSPVGRTSGWCRWRHAGRNPRMSIQSLSAEESEKGNPSWRRRCIPPSATTGSSNKSSPESASSRT